MDLKGEAVAGGAQPSFPVWLAGPEHYSSLKELALEWAVKLLHSSRTTAIDRRESSFPIPLECYVEVSF